jgi:uncharacterized protein
VNVERHHDPARFAEEATEFLLHDEPRHNLLLGLSGTLATKPDIYPERSFWIVREGDEVVACALRTAPYNLVLAQPRDDEALEVLADAIDDELPGVTAAVPEVDAFAEHWTREHGVTSRVVIGQGVYALERVIDPPPAPGSYREATEGDLELVLDWYEAFIDEALRGIEPGGRAQHERNIRHRLASPDGGVGLWEDDAAAVSLCGYGGPTPNGVRIGPVYTPPPLRGHGYATSLTAEVSRRRLAAGRRFCFLYTDLANPTSNAIYERIGYVRVCESRQLAFA